MRIVERTHEGTDMPSLHWLSYFFGGAFLVDAIPYLVSGVSGRPFQTAFADPPGQGLSSSTVNVLWGFLNLVAGYLRVYQVGDFDLRNLAEWPRRRRWGRSRRGSSS